MRDVARVYDGVEQDKTASWYQGTRNIIAVDPEAAGIERRGRSSTRSRRCCRRIRAQLPPSVSLDVRMDRSDSIRESVHDVKLTLLLTIVLVIAVIFVFLRSVTATIIPSLTLPVSLIATFAVMYLLNYSLDNLSLMALTLCIGFVVDDTIVMLENIGRHMEMGKPAMRAAFDGAKEVEFTIIAMTVSLVAVFIPVLFMGGIVGRLLQEFAVTIGVAILVSCFVSISLTPMLCSRFLKTSHGKTHGRLYNADRAHVRRLAARSTTCTLQFALRHRAVTMALSLLLVAGAAYLFTIVPKGFLPTRGSGPLPGQHRGDPGHRLRGDGAPSAGSRRRFSRRIPTSPASAAAWATAAAGAAGSSSNQGRISVDLKPRSERTRVGRPDHGAAAAEAGAGARRARVHGQPASDQPRRHAAARARLPVHAAGHRHRRALSRGAAVRRSDARTSRASRTSTAICG